MTPVSQESARFRVRILLAQRRMTLRDLAREIGMGYGTVRNVVNGSKTARPARERIHRFFGEDIWPLSQDDTAAENAPEIGPEDALRGGHSPKPTNPAFEMELFALCARIGGIAELDRPSTASFAAWLETKLNGRTAGSLSLEELLNHEGEWRAWREALNTSTEDDKER
jgi:transcriptional regulator with XRE-family HTH domain